MPRVFIPEEAREAVTGLLRIAEIAVPETFHNTDRKIRAARRYLGHETVPCHRSVPERFPDGTSRPQPCRMGRCENGRQVIRGNGVDSVTNGDMFITAYPCACRDEAPFIRSLEDDLGPEEDDVD